MKIRKINNKGFSLVELTVVVAVLVVLIGIFAPALLRYTEDSRIQKDESAMDEVCNSVKLAISDAETFDEVCSYAIPDNYITYTDSSGSYGARFTDEEYWAPDGSGHAMTITFNPDENGDFDIANGVVNNMTNGNGSVAEARAAAEQQCLLKDMGNQKLYSALKQSLGPTLENTSATYKNSSYTVFVAFEVVDGIKRADVYGEFNGTNLAPDSLASLGSGTHSYDDAGEPEASTPQGGTTRPNINSSDLMGGGGSFSGAGAGVTPETPNVEPEVPAEPVVLITFEYNDKEYQAAEGMTWAEWCNSEYNIDGYVCPQGGRVVKLNAEDPSDPLVEGPSLVTMSGFTISMKSVCGEDEIIADKNYSKWGAHLSNGMLVVNPANRKYVSAASLGLTTNDDVVNALRDGTVSAVATAGGIFEDSAALSAWFAN